VDIWACGVTLYNMVSGEYPFEGDVIMKLFENIINHPLHMPSNVQLSTDLEQLLHGMLRKEPEMRWNSLRIRASKWFLHSHKIVCSINLIIYFNILRMIHGLFMCRQ